MTLALSNSADHRPLVSIVIPAFNCSRHIVECIDSALNQTYSAVEIIVVDDGSTDDTRQKLQPYVEAGKIRYRYQANKGPAAARNAGVRLSRGKYLQFLDGDDLLSPVKIERQVAQLEAAAAPAIGACDYRYFDGCDTSKLYGGDIFKGQLPLDKCERLFEFETVIHRWLIPAALFEQCGGFDEGADIIGTEDWLLLWKLCADGTNVLFVDEPLVLYRKHVATLTCDFQRIGLSHLGVIDRVEAYRTASGRKLYSRRQLNQLREPFHYQLALDLLRSNRRLGAWRQLIKAFRVSANRRQVKLLLLGATPVLGPQAIDWVRSADPRLWNWRSKVRGLISASPVPTIRRAFYEWRQRRPVRRLAAVVALIFAGPSAFVLRRLGRLFSSSKEKRLLILHFGGLGDTIMLTPALRALKERFPHARLDVITLHQNVSNAFRDHPRIDSITTLPAYAGQWIISKFTNLSSVKLLLATIRYYPEVLLRFIFGRYDLAINFGIADFDQKLGNALMFCLGVPMRVAAGITDERLITHPVATNQASQHRVESYFNFLKPLGITNAQQAYEYPVSARDNQSARELLLDRGIARSRQLAVIHPGGKLHVNSRRWPAEYFAQVCDFLFSEGFEVVLTGDRDDAAVCEEVARWSNHQAKIIAGRLTFSESAALLSLADLVVTNDTATLHLAGAVGVPRVISIFGPTDPSLLVPRNGRHIVLQSNLPCAPCMGGIIDEKTERCWRDVKEECLWQTTPEQVIAVLGQQYARRAARVASA